MPFQYLLTNLLVDVPGAVGAILADDEGEAVEWVTRHGDPYDLKVEGAWHSIFGRLIATAWTACDGDRITGYALAGERFVALTHVLPAGYYVVLVLDRGAALGIGRRRLAHVARLLADEVA